MLSRRALLRSSLALAAAACTRAPAPPAGPPGALEALGRGLGWLWGQQSAEGLFASPVFGLMASGQSLTPFCLLSAVHAPADRLPWPAEGTRRAAEALHRMMGPEGAVGLGGVAADYPVYATAMAISALARVAPGALVDWAAPMVDWLRAQQLGAGWEATAAHGGFPMGSRAALSPPEAGHVDLSMTRRALEALRDAGERPHEASRAFVERCRAADGAFFYSPVEEAVNKAGRGEQGMRGYGSATADGVLALRALGAGPEDPAVQAGLAWLHTHHRVDGNPGLEEGMPVFAPAMRFYYRAASALVFAELGGPEGWRERLCTALLAEQQADGRWQSDNPLQKESEPLIATGFAVQALSAALRGG